MGQLTRADFEAKAEPMPLGVKLLAALWGGLYLAMIVMGLTGCVPTLPPGARVLAPSADVVAVWHKIESCAGVTRPISEMSFYELPGVLTFEHRGRAVWGYYLPPAQIVMGEEAYFLDPPLGHEMLHAILRTVEHPHEFTVECAALVTPP